MLREKIGNLIMLATSEKSQAIGKDLKSQENVGEFKIQGCDSPQKYTYSTPGERSATRKDNPCKEKNFKIEGWRQGELLKENLFPGVR